MSDSDIQRALAIAVLHLDVVSTAKLMLRVNVTERQWSGIGQVVDSILPAGIKQTDGGILPSIGTVKKWLEENGGRLKMSDVKPVAIEATPPTPSSDEMEDTADPDPFASCAQVDEPSSMHGYFITS
jgi:hypothetical protein